MTPDHNQDNLLAHISQALQQEPDAMKSVLETLLNLVMKAERSIALRAAPYERSDECAGLRRYFTFYNEQRPHQSLSYRTPAEVYHEER